MTRSLNTAVPPHFGQGFVSRLPGVFMVLIRRSEYREEACRARSRAAPKTLKTRRRIYKSLNDHCTTSTAK
jgi:hypothetical protein